MDTVLLTVGSITLAQRARDLLNARGISARLVRSQSAGCSYGVRVQSLYREEARTLLRNAGIKAEVT